MLERRRFSVAGPSSVNGTIASSTVTEAIVSSLGLRVADADPDLARLELDAADVERVGGRRVRPIRSTSDAPPETNAPTTSASSRIGASAQSRQASPERLDAPGLHQSTTSK